MADAPALKDFIDRDSVAAVVAAVSAAAGGIDDEAVLEDIFDNDWDDRALKQRIRHIAVILRAFLPEEYPEALGIMRKAAETVETGWMSVWAFNDFVEEYGVEFPEISLPALEQFTKLASAEFAVRPFIIRYPDLMAVQMQEWAQDSDFLVRRLASEGFRPRLPWGMGIPAIKADPTPVLPVLTLLRTDPAETVRRSVANNLNDISKDHPDLVVELLDDWSDGSDEMDALIKHATRTLLKQGHPGALRLLGFSPTPLIEVGSAGIDPQSASVGDSVWLELELLSTASGPQSLMVDYAVVFQNVSGTGSRKVFKGLVAQLDAGETLRMRRKISLAQQTTRRIIPGPHSVEVQVNGAVVETVPFDVTG